MYLTIHAAIGATAGKIFSSEPLIAFAIGVASHFIFDAIPHGDENIKTWKLFRTKMQRTAAAALIDFAILLIFAVIWIKNSSASEIPSIMYGMSGAMLPDVLCGFQELTGTSILNWHIKFHSWAHKIIKTNIPTLWGFVFQSLILFALTWFIIKN